MTHRPLLILFTLLGIGPGATAQADLRQVPTPEPSPKVELVNPRPTMVSGVFPQSAVMAPGSEVYGEVALGGLVAWANRLWAVGSVADKDDRGIGLYEVEPDLSVWLHRDSVPGSYANRMVHWPSNQAFAGPYAIRVDGQVRTLNRMKDHRLAATMGHLTQPDRKVYFLTEPGLLFEVDVQSLGAVQIADVKKALGLRGKPRFTAAHTGQGRVVVAATGVDGGCLAEWNGRSWTVIERGSWVEVSGGKPSGAGSHRHEAVFAVGRTRSSGVLRVLEGGIWSRYLIPLGREPSEAGTACIRELQSGQYLMDAFGMFYEFSKPSHGEWPIRPISCHLRRVKDLCQYRGLLVLAGGPTGSAVGQPQSAMWFGSVDDLWKFGKPSGRGGPWRNTSVQAGQVSDPFLMGGFDNKMLYVRTAAPTPVTVVIEADFLGDGTWSRWATVVTGARESTSTATYVFPDGFSARWIRLSMSMDCTVTAQFLYR